MTRTVSLVEPAAGACVVRITNRFETANSATSRTIGTTIPPPITTYQPVRSPGFEPSSSSPTPRRPARFQESSRSATTTASPIQAPAIIHQKRLAMSLAWWLFGASAFWSPPHPASSSTAGTRTHGVSLPPGTPLIVAPRPFRSEMARRSNAVPSGDRLEFRARATRAHRGRGGPVCPARLDAAQPGAAGPSRQGPQLRRRAARDRPRAGLANRRDRRGAAVLGAHGPAPDAQRHRPAADRARAAGAAAPPAARLPHRPVGP